MITAAALDVGAPLTEMAPRRLRVSAHQVPWELPQRLRVVHLTDIHVGLSTPLDHLRQAIAAAAQARPDLVVLTGDYLNRSLKYVRRLRQFVASLPRPCVAVLGNHDYYSGADGVTRALEREGVRVLVNDSLTFTLRGGVLPIVGIDDETMGTPDVPRAFHRVTAPQRALVLVHHPRTAARVAEHGGRLILAGHTHGGQISLPWITDAIGRLGGNHQLAGWYQQGASALYVNAGVGSGALRLRLGRDALPEVAIFDLVPRHRGGAQPDRPRRCTRPLPPLL